MQRSFLLAVLVSTTLLGTAGAGAGCGGEGGAGGEGGGSDPCFDYGSFKETPNVAFAADVLPILRSSCGLSSSCHGTESAPADQPFLGLPGNTGAMSESQIAAVFSQNVGVSAATEPSMQRVRAGDAANSFMMHKIDATLTCPDLDCAADQSCGDAMPPPSGGLSSAQANTIRSWILQGAKND